MLLSSLSWAENLNDSINDIESNKDLKREIQGLNREIAQLKIKNTELKTALSKEIQFSHTKVKEINDNWTKLHELMASHPCSSKN